jgi:SAM-dependent methyltransferase
VIPSRDVSRLTRIAVVISSFDHVAVLEKLLRTTQRVIRHFDLPASVYVLDPDGRQETAQLTRALGATVVRQHGQGYGAVIRTALEATHGDYIVTLHGDGVHPPELLPQMFAMRDRADLVIASRYAPQGFAQMPWWRTVLSRLLNAWFGRMLGLPIRDLSSSYRFYRRDLLEAIAPSMSTDAALQEILVKTFCEGYSIAEVPTHYIAKPGSPRQGSGRLARLGRDYTATFGTMWKLRNSIHSCDYDTRAFFSRIPLQRWWQRRRCSIVSACVGDAMRVLDAGCGSTQLLNRLPHAVGMDYALRKLRFMRRPGRRLVNGSTLDLPFRSEAFDVVISSQVIEHLKADARVFTELVRCLAPGGTLVLGTVDYGRWQWPLLERLYDLFKPTGYAQEHITHYTRKSLFDQLHVLGLSVESCQYICGGEIIIKAKKASSPGPARASAA